MNKDFVFPKIKKKLGDFFSDEEGAMLRSKAAVLGPVAVGTVLLMNKELTLTAAATKHQSHLSHRSHASGVDSHVSHASGEASNATSIPTHSSHSSGLSSGFSHTADTFEAEARNAGNN